MKLLARTKVGEGNVVIGKSSQMKKIEAEKHHPPKPPVAEHSEQQSHKQIEAVQSRTS